MTAWHHFGVWWLVLAGHALALSIWWSTARHPTSTPQVVWLQADAVIQTPPSPRPTPRPPSRSMTETPTPIVTRTPTTPQSPGLAPIAPVMTTPSSDIRQGSLGVAAVNPAPSGPRGGAEAAPARDGVEDTTLPSLSAAYLQKPEPPYPRISQRMGEQGRVVVRVLIDEQGLPQKAELDSTSGYPRLDRAALDAVLTWRYVPGQRGGRAQAMWFNVPITFELKPHRD